MINITKKKFNRIISKIENSIKRNDNSLPYKLCEELRCCNLWSYWCECVINYCSPNISARPHHRKSALPEFIKHLKNKILL